MKFIYEFLEIETRTGSTGVLRTRIYNVVRTVFGGKHVALEEEIGREFAKPRMIFCISWMARKGKKDGWTNPVSDHLMPDFSRLEGLLNC